MGAQNENQTLSEILSILEGYTPGGGGGGVTSLTNTDGSLDITGSGDLLIATDVVGMLTVLGINSAAIDPLFTSDGSDLIYNGLTFMSIVGLVYPGSFNALTNSGALLYNNTSNTNLADAAGNLYIGDETNLGSSLSSWQNALGIAGVQLGVTQTTTPVTSITTENGIITAMS